MRALSSIVAIAAAVATVADGFTPNKPSYIDRYPGAKPFDQSFLEGYSILKHLGGQGPYSNRRSYGIGRDPPDGCAVDQVIMLRRHGERYPEPAVAAVFNDVLAKVYASNLTNGGAFGGSLEFLNRWETFMPNEGYWALESYSGPYAGLLEAYGHGVEYRIRYGHLWDQEPGVMVPMFTSSYERIVQTARKFGEGFFGWNYTTSVALNVLSEDETMGANSLTPACVHDDDYEMCKSLPGYMPQFDVAVDRLKTQNPGLDINATDVFNLMKMVAYELNVRGHSDWIDAFSLDEWTAFGYTQNLDFYYCAGPGDKNMAAVGAVYANATLLLLNQGPEKAGKMFWNFAHDTNITPILSALGLFVPSSHLPLDRIPFPNPYEIGDIMPMGGRLVMERLSCNSTAVTPQDTYVRLVLNEAVVPFPDCQEGPGFSCSLANYTRLLEEKLPDYTTTCGIPEESPQYLKFFWEANTTQEWNWDPKVIPYQWSFIL
ncbi:phytase B [Pseudomassariella vexata]|uniref:3-phytase n=1 Tax=Pseudomassariella vexata TaxID=1141098 RepID=A0A1Y2D8N3_9PEZI|nr:phytase B [Pseudomassariella vexata]ORY55618.1 phytase B [Pseudomassariella vexata]